MADEAVKITKRGYIRGKVAERFDGWFNILTNLGIFNRDRNTGGRVEWNPLEVEEAGELYAQDGTAAKIVDELPHDMMRAGFEVTHEKYPDLDSDLRASLERFQTLQKIERAMKWARLHGGAAILLGIEDGGAPTDPLNESGIRRLRWVTVLHRHQISVSRYQMDITLPGYLEPDMYMINARDAGHTGVEIHASRIVRFDGVEIPDEMMEENGGWGDSALTRAFCPLRNYNLCHDSTANIIQGFAKGIIKMKNLSAMLAAGNDAIIQKRLQLMNLTSAASEHIVIEEGEEYDRKSVALAGLPETLAVMGRRLVSATDMPHTKVLGESPSGLGATGESEQDNWYDLVASKQESYLRPRLTALLDIFLRSSDGPTKGVFPEGYSLKFLSLYQTSDSEAADIHLKQAQADKIYLDSGVLDSSEVATSRFGGDDYSIETTLNLDIRDDMNAIEEEEPPPQPPGAQPGSTTPTDNPQPGQPNVAAAGVAQPRALVA